MNEIFIKNQPVLSKILNKMAQIVHTNNSDVSKKIYETKIYLETAELFVWTICAILFSILLEKIFLKLLYHISKRIGISYENKSNTTI